MDANLALSRWPDNRSVSAIDQESGHARASLCGGVAGTPRGHPLRPRCLLAGGDGLRRERRWVALAPHLGEEVEVDAGERELLGALSPSDWVDARTLAAHPAAALKRLLKTGLLIGSTKPHAAHRERDERLRDSYWHPLAATLHAFTRWRDADAVQSMKDSGTETARELREVLGPPPLEAAERGDAVQRLPLPRSAPTAFDDLLARRTTCRNFDPARPLPQALFAQLLRARVLGAERSAGQRRHHLPEEDQPVRRRPASDGGVPDRAARRRRRARPLPLPGARTRAGTAARTGRCRCATSS